jgi:hypothetical protein
MCFCRPDIVPTGGEYIAQLAWPSKRAGRMQCNFLPRHLGVCVCERVL